MATCNYRAIQHKDKSISIYEVYYQADGSPQLMTEEAVQLDRYSSFADLKNELKIILKSLDTNPTVLNYKEVA